MQIKTSRGYLDFICAALLNYFPLLRKSLYANVSHCNKTAPEYLQVRIINSVMKELDLMLRKKQLTLSRELKLSFSDAQGIILYKILLEMPLPPENVFGNLARSAWLQQLDQQITYDLTPQNEFSKSII